MGEAHCGSGDQTRRGRVTVGISRVKKAARGWGRRDREMGIQGAGQHIWTGSSGERFRATYGRRRLRNHTNY
jgi:hypothetical protein